MVEYKHGVIIIICILLGFVLCNYLASSKEGFSLETDLDNVGDSMDTLVDNTADDIGDATDDVGDSINSGVNDIGNQLSSSAPPATASVPPATPASAPPATPASAPQGNQPPSLKCINEVKNWKTLSAGGKVPPGAMPPSLDCINEIKNFQAAASSQSSAPQGNQPPSLKCINEVKNWKTLSAGGKVPPGAMPPSLDCINEIKNFQEAAGLQSSATAPPASVPSGAMPPTLQQINAIKNFEDEVESSITYDNYNHYTKTYSPTTFYGPNGGKATLMAFEGKYAIMITDSAGNMKIYTLSQQDNGLPTFQPTSLSQNNTALTITDEILKSRFSCGEDGSSAKIFKSKDNKYAIEIELASGKRMIFVENNIYTFNNTLNPNNSCSTQQYCPGQPTNISSPYESLLPEGIPRNIIPKGQEDMYILKSQVIPPVCPMCPSVGPYTMSNSQDSDSTSAPAGAMPPTLKQINAVKNWEETISSASTYTPLYGSNLASNASAKKASSVRPGSQTAPTSASSASKADYLPMPVLNDFSQFGM